MIANERTPAQTSKLAAGRSAPGWYPNEYDPNSERWFDGVNWTPTTRPTGGAVRYPQPWPADAAAAGRGPSVAIMWVNALLAWCVLPAVYLVYLTIRNVAWARKRDRPYARYLAPLVTVVAAFLLLVVIGANLSSSASSAGGPMTPDKLAQSVLDADHDQNTANPLSSVSCDPQSVQADGSGTYECTETFQSGGMSWPTITVNPDGSWN
jgi:Protein of unknown function (DUF2510)